MPLYKGEKNIGKNVKTLKKEGKHSKQTIAIALEMAKRKK